MHRGRQTSFRTRVQSHLVSQKSTSCTFKSFFQISGLAQPRPTSTPYSVCSHQRFRAQRPEEEHRATHWSSVSRTLELDFRLDRTPIVVFGLVCIELAPFRPSGAGTNYRACILDSFHITRGSGAWFNTACSDQLRDPISVCSEGGNNEHDQARCSVTVYIEQRLNTHRRESYTASRLHFLTHIHHSAIRALTNNWPSPWLPR